MELLFFLIIVILLVVASIIVWRISDWEFIDKFNKGFYQNGYHIYYDRKIINKIVSEECK
ncbi:MAG: hypothetical protein H6Q12_229 [Bacteroidetes bacterium]|nr:hypothetical protein [Bacteroidota bacterium]